MGPGIIFSSAKPSLSELADLHLAAFGNDELNPPEGALDYLDKSGAILRFSYNDGKLVGHSFGEKSECLRYVKEAQVPDIRSTIYIPLFATHPEWKGRGIGKQLLQQTLDEAHSNGYISARGFFKPGPARQSARSLLTNLRDRKYENFAGSKETYHFILGRI